MVKLHSTRQRVLRVLVGVFSLVCVLSQTARAQDMTLRVSNLRQDASGQVWGSGTVNGKGTNAIYTWERDAWRAHRLMLGQGASSYLSADVSQRTPRGAVVYLWNTHWAESEKNVAIVTQHFDKTSRIIARGKMSPSTQAIFQSARGTTWITTGNAIHRVVGAKIRHEYSIRRAQMHSGVSAAETMDDLNLLQMSEDTRGRAWFWSNTLSGSPWYRSLRGVLVFDGKKWTHFPRIAGTPDKPLTVLQPKDARHFWMAVGDNALYELDTTTMRARKIVEPQRGAFRWVQKIVRLDNSWCVFADRPGTEYPDGDHSLRDTDLWRFRNKKWQKIASGLDGGGEISERPSRAIAQDKSGLWIGSPWGGVWFVPQSSARLSGEKVIAPRRIDWRNGLDLLNTAYLFRLRDGRIAAFNGSYGLKVVTDVRPFLRLKATSAHTTFTTFGNLFRDARGHMWRIPTLKSRVLQEWNGSRWVSRSVPREINLSRHSNISVDTRNRVWLLPDFRDDKVAFYDVKAGAWRVFSSLQSALQEQVKTLGWRGAAALEIGKDNEYSMPRFAAPRQITFKSEAEKIRFFDGKVWRAWTRKQIKRDSLAGETEFDGSPFFSGEGNLRVNIEGQTWEWTRATNWQHCEEQIDTPERYEGVKAPAGSPTKEPESIVRDDSGATWITFNRQLYKSAFGLWAPQFSPRERHPFQDGRSIRAVLPDNRGNLFLATGFNSEEIVVVPRRAPLPQTRIALKKIAVDDVNLMFSISAVGKHWFRWRLDGGAWSQPSTRSLVELRDLPGGTHKIEAQTIDRFLQTDSDTAKTTFRVNINTAQQVAASIESLGSPDYTVREAAIIALARQPQNALPALRKAREQSAEDSDKRWWIDAAIQRIENAK